MKPRVLRSVGVVLVVVGILAGCGGGSSVLTLDRIGQEDAPNTMTVQLNNSYTHQAATPSWADGFEKSFTKFAEDHPDWKLELKIIPDDATTQEQATPARGGARRSGAGLRQRRLLRRPAVHRPGRTEADRRVLHRTGEGRPVPLRARRRHR